MHELPEIESYDPKEVFAFSGLALYYGQVLEKGLVVLLMLFHRDGLDITRNEYDKTFAGYDKQTLGKLLNLVKSKYDYSQDEIDILQESLEKRNYIVHKFFWHHAAAFDTEVGIKVMLIELQEIIKCFQIANDISQKIANQMLTKFGLSSQYIEEVSEQMKQEFLDSLQK